MVFAIDPPLVLAPDAATIPASAGIGLRFAHQSRVADERPKADWLEVHAENYFGEGVATDLLLEIRERYPISVHATGLSLGSTEGVDATHLAGLAELCRRINPGLVSDHLSWSAAGGIQMPDLLPLPYTEEALEVVIRNVDRVQSALRRRLLIENPSIYYAFDGAALTEGAFLGELVRRSGCGVLLDVNNVAVTAGNIGAPAAARLRDILDSVPSQAIGEIHLAGHALKLLEPGGFIRIDDHGSRVAEETWLLFDLAIRRIGPRPTLIEWDTNIPAFEVLQEEAVKAQAHLDAGGSAVLNGKLQLVHAS